jgi:hypothetical protein
MVVVQHMSLKVSCEDGTVSKENMYYEQEEMVK